MKNLHLSTLALVSIMAIITYSSLFAQDLPNADTQTYKTEISEEEKKSDNEKTSYNPIIPRIKDEEAVDTLYPDPLTDKFQKKSHIDSKEKGKSVSQLIEEFESQAAKIASETIIPDNIEEEKIEELTEEDIKNGNSDEDENENSETTEEILYDENTSVKEYTEEDLPYDDGSTPLPDMLPIEEQISSETSELIILETPEEKEETLKPKKKKKQKRRKKKEPKYEKAEALEPILLEDGNPAKDESETDKVIILIGRIIPEMQAVSRKKKMFRWVLKQEDGNRIPLRSNIKIMQEVKKEDMFEKEIELTGHYQTSGMNSNIKYFIVEKVKEKNEEENSEELIENSEDITNNEQKENIEQNDSEINVNEQNIDENQ